MSDLLYFRAGRCDLGLNVSDVREVVPAASLSHPPDASLAIEGLLNLRGQVVPVVRLQNVLRIEQPPLAETDFLIIVADGEDRLFAVRANSDVQLTEEFTAVAAEKTVNSPAVQQTVKVGTRIISVLNPDAISPHAHDPSAAIPERSGQ